MGPTALFDKSFLQSLSLDESVFFDHFFYTVVCPIFFVETLADLEKAVREGRTPEQEVGIIADKAPEMNSAPNLSHVGLAIQDLLGNTVTMDGRMLLAGGQPVRLEGSTGVVFEPTPEAEAFQRWQNGEFLEVERRFAKRWREALNNIDLVTVAAGMRAMGIGGKTCKSLEEAKAMVDAFLNRTDNVPDQIKLAVVILGGPSELETLAVERWHRLGCPSLKAFAP